MNQTRRLAAILAADVAGFYSLIDADSGGTLRALTAIRRDLVDPTIEAHSGRLLKTNGDRLLVEFSNVVEALRCAIDLQRTVAEHNRNLPTGKRIEFRIGIHQGDVVVQDAFLFGDGVNIATDLEGLAEPGGICLSARAKEDAEGKLAVQFEDMGEQQFKNRSRRVRTYQISPAGASSVGVSERATRRLAAILAADVVGYSRLMGADEEGTHERLKAHFGQLVEPKVKEHRGRIVKNTGDGMLVEFSSVVDAVRCAVEVQGGMAEREPGEPEERRIRFRIGVNLGDVIVEEHDIFGDGVNVAARLEGLAEAGGICISRMVRDQIRDKLPYQFEDLGEQSVKNIARPVRVYAWSPEAVAELPVPKGPPPVTTISPSAVAPRLSIVVLPFTNLSDDREQQYFADGITEDLTTDLSRIENMFVISRNTAFTYQGKRVDTKQIGRELGVRYVLEGSVRRSGNHIRVNAQLIDAETDAHLWAERFDRDIGDLFALQNEITSRIAVALNMELIGAEAARPTSHPDALDYILRGRAAGLMPPSRDSRADAVRMFERARALALDQQSVAAQSYLATALTARVMDNMTDSAAADLARAEGLVEQALAASPRNPHVHYAKGQVLRTQRRFAEAISEYEKVLSFDRNWVFAYHLIGQCKLYIGQIEEVIPAQEQAIRLSPRDPRIGTLYMRIGLVHLLQSRTEEAIHWLEKARSANPAHPLFHAYLASAYALKGETARATAAVAEARRLSGDDRYSSIARLKAVGYFGVPKIRALFEATYFVGLRKAGVPEE